MAVVYIRLLYIAGNYFIFSVNSTQYVS